VSENHHDDLVQRSEATDEALALVVEPLVRADAAHRRIMRVLIVVSTVLALAILALTFTMNEVITNSRGLAKIEDICKANNEAKSVEKGLWDFILGIPPSTPQTQQQIDNRKIFTQKIAEAYKPRDCNIP
jgi:hypothetical protein